MNALNVVINVIALLGVLGVFAALLRGGGGWR